MQELKMPHPRDFCMTEPCMRHGNCINGESTYSCECTPRYVGKNCEFDLGSPCNKTPCENDGICSEDTTGNYSCSCPQGFTGRHCENEIKLHPLCVNNMCLNGGSCQVRPDSSQTECVCILGFTGANCEFNVNECNPNPCENDGVCNDGFNNYTCDCSHTGYTGWHCEVNIDECLTNPCLNHGICFDTYGSYLCQCAPGFEGPNCQYVSVLLEVVLCLLPRIKIIKINLNVVRKPSLLL